jgi:SWI/SNF related-matrix-associated actin-dependent regulator of chromatin subfamily C
LAGAVNPAVGAVAAQSVLRVLLEAPADDQVAGDEDSDDEGTSYYSRESLEKATAAGLTSAIEQAHALAKHEDAEIQRMVQIAITTQVKKLDLKLQQYEELEQSLMNEQKDLEKQRVMLITSINAMNARAPHLAQPTSTPPQSATTPSTS